MLARQATEGDVQAWRELRRDGIQRYPSAFIVTLAEHDASSPAEDENRLALGNSFLVFDGKTAVGLGGINRLSNPRQAHRAEIGPLYVCPAAQGTAAVGALLNALLDHAQGLGVWQVELFVNEANPRAVGLYRRFGFEQIGRIPNAMIGQDGPEHDLMMIKMLAAKHPLETTGQSG